jgi:hypothetical protein
MMTDALKLKPVPLETMLLAGIPPSMAANLAVEGDHMCFLGNECGAAGRWASDEITSLRNQLRTAKRAAPAHIKEPKP